LVETIFGCHRLELVVGQAVASPPLESCFKKAARKGVVWRSCAVEFG